MWGEGIASLLGEEGEVLLVSTEYARNAEHARARTGGLTAELKRRGIQVREHAVHRSAQFGPMPAPRHYRNSTASHEEAIEHIRSERGKHFDPELVYIFVDAKIGHADD